MRCTHGICELVDQGPVKNKNFLWVKFTLLDDEPNGNFDRVPKDEFRNVVLSSVYAPIKANFQNGILGGHEGAVPVGVITEVAEVENKIEAIGVIWRHEWPELAKYLSEVSGPFGVSWELMAGKVEAGENGEEILKDVQITAATIVSNPAYGERTKIEVVAEKWSRKYINDLPDCAFLYIEPGGKKDEDGKTTPRSLRHLPVKNHNCEIDLPHLRNAIARLEQSRTGKRDGETWLTESLRKRLLEKARRMLEQAKKKEADMACEEKLKQLEEQNKQLVEKLQAAEQKLAEIQKAADMLEAEEAFMAWLREVGVDVEKAAEFIGENKEYLLQLYKSGSLQFLRRLFALRVEKEAEQKEEVPVLDTPAVTEDDEFDVRKLAKALKKALREEGK